MEQSEQPVQIDTQDGVGERGLKQVPPLAPPTFTKVDNNLTGIGFFTASSKRSRKAIEKTTIVIDRGVEHKISILPSAKYGLPITQDQDYWLALMKLASEHLQRAGKITNPFTFTTAELTKILGQAHSGKNYKAVNEWMSVMNSTAVEGGTYNASKKSWHTEKTHAVDRVIMVGKQLSDGTVADKNYVWFSQWQLDNINAGNLIAIELTTYTQLQNNISKNLVPHLQEWLFASQADGRFEKQYEDVCQLLGIRVYRYHSDVERQLQPSLDELAAHCYLSRWAIEPMANQKNYKLVLWHGSKYHRDRQTRIDRKQRAQLLPSAGEKTTPTSHRPKQRHFNLKPSASDVQAEPAPVTVIDYRLVAELAKRGISETDARTILSALPVGQAVLDQLEWGDFQIEQSHGKITNPPGFYISLLQRGVVVPPTFETSTTRNARQQAEFERQQAIQKETEAQLAAEAAADFQLDQIQATQPELYQSLYAQAQAELTMERPNIAEFLRSHPGSSLHDGAIRVRMKNLLAGQPAQNLHQDTNSTPRQDDRLQELSSVSASGNPQAAVPTPASHPPPSAPVSQPMKPAAPVSEQGRVEAEQPFNPLTRAQLFVMLSMLYLPAPKSKN